MRRKKTPEEPKKITTEDQSTVELQNPFEYVLHNQALLDEKLERILKKINELSEEL